MERAERQPLVAVTGLSAPWEAAVKNVLSRVTSALSCRSQECWEVAFKKMIIVSCFSVVVGNLHAGDDGQVGLEVPVHVSHHANLDILVSLSMCKKN